MNKELIYKIDAMHDGMNVHAYARGVAGISLHLIRSIKYQVQGITVNGQRATTRQILHTGDELIFRLPGEKSQRIQAVEGPVDILYEDEDLILVNKPSGMVVHPCHGHYTDTLLNYLAYREQQQGSHGHLGPVGRLDRDTSGLLFVSRHAHSAARMEMQRKNGQLRRYYYALAAGIMGQPGEKGYCDSPIEKVPDRLNCYRVGPQGRPSLTHYEIIGSGHSPMDGTPYTMLKVKLETGRTHQIRVHMASLGHPLLGDPIYGDSDNSDHVNGASDNGDLDNGDSVHGHEAAESVRRNGGFSRAALHSCEIVCQIGDSQEKRSFTAPLPPDFVDAGADKILNQYQTGDMPCDTI